MSIPIKINAKKWMRLSAQSDEIISILRQHNSILYWNDIFQPRYNYILLKLSRKALNEDIIKTVFHPIRIMRFLELYPEQDAGDYMN
jgi:hypothetical protein